MADLGVTAESVGEVARIATAGDYSSALAKLNLPQRQVPIRVQMPESARAQIDVLEQLPVHGKSGNVKLASVADITVSSGSAQINRLDRSRNVAINIELNGRQLGDVFAEVGKLPSLKSLPPGVRRGESGDAERMQELFGSFGMAMLTGVLCVYVVLVLLFKDFLQPVTILAALPFSFGGAFVALLVTHSSFSMPSLIGLLMLMGIVTKNSILLVDYAIMARRDHGMNRSDALIDACSKRARPIVMTTIAMGAGMLPIAMGLGAEPSFRMPMATAVIGGLITSTLLSLFVVPVVFTYVDDLMEKFKRLRRSESDMGIKEIEA
jgi:multidrug efflux pump subunit AcrB